MHGNKNIASLVTAVLGLFLGIGAWSEALRVYVEAEDCDGLQNYPYHNEDAQGWYARQANVRVYGADGRSYYAAIHENARARTMNCKLQQPIPPGKYNVFLRVVGSGGTHESAITVKVGDRAVEFAWSGKKRSPRWLDPMAFTLDKPADTIEFTALRFGGSSHVALYMPVNKTIWLDTVYITSDLSEKAPPALTEERYLRAGIDPKSVPERKAHKADYAGPNMPSDLKPEAKAMDEPVVLKAFDGRRNLWPNSSFEMGMNDGWACGSSSHVFTDADLVDANPFHGKYCFRVQGKAPFSKACRLENGGKIAISAYVRGDGRDVRMELRRIPGRGDADFVRDPGKKGYRFEVVLTAKGKADKEWARITTSGDVKPGWYYLAFSDGEFYADAVQVEAGETATDYQPRAELEGAVRSGQFGNIIYGEEQNTLDVWLNNSSKEKRNVSVRYRIVDVRERVVAEGKTEPMEVEAGATVKKAMNILPKLWGMFSVSFVVDGRSGVDGETVYLVMPKPGKKATRHELGGNMSPDSDAEMAVQSRLGLKWVLTCKSRQFAAASEGAHTEPGVWNWRDEAAAKPAKYGMQLQPAMWLDRTPDFMRERVERRSRALRGFDGPRDAVPRTDLWKEHVGKVVEHYKGNIRWWCIDDEVEGVWDPSWFAELVGETADVVHKVDPGIKVGFSGYTDFTEEMFKFISPDKLDFLGASTFDLNFIEGLTVNHLSDKYGKPYFCYGVGGRPPEHTMYHTLYHFLPPYGKAAHMAQRVINLLLVQDIKCAGHYAAIFANNGVHYGLNKPLCDYDGTPLPWGGTFGCLGTFLADAEPVEHVMLGDTDRVATVFKIGERYGFTTYATRIKDLDIHYLPAEQEFKGMTFPCAEGSVEVLDMYWNPRGDAKWKEGRLQIDLNAEPVFVMDKSLGKDGLVKMIRESRRPVSDYGISVALVPVEKGIDIEIKVRNNTKADIRDVGIDMRSFKDPFTTAGEWLPAMPCAAMGTIPAGSEKTARLRTVLDGKTPYEDGGVRAHVYGNNGTLQVAADEALWLMPCPRGNVSVDGDKRDWPARKSAWLAYEWSCMLMSRRHAQLYENEENFLYPSYRLDGRAQVWACHDEKNLYLMVRLEDDQPILTGEKGDWLRLMIGSTGKRQEVALAPMGDGSVKVLSGGLPVVAKSFKTQETISNGARLEQEKITPVHVEMSIPWDAVGIKPAVGSLVEFDLFWTDVDQELGKEVEGTLRWAGRSSHSGYLMLND